MKASAKTNLKQVKNGHEFLIDMGTWDVLIIRNSRYNPVTDEQELTDTYRVTYRYPKYADGKVLIGEFTEYHRIESLATAIRYFNRYEIGCITNLTTDEEHA